MSVATTNLLAMHWVSFQKLGWYGMKTAMNPQCPLVGSKWVASGKSNFLFSSRVV
jgi:hypothetical protein